MNDIAKIAQRLIRSERGSIDTFAWGCIFGFGLVSFMIITIIAVGVYRYVYWNYGEVNNALQFGVYSAVVESEMSGQSTPDPSVVKKQFVYALEQTTGSLGNGVPGTFTGGKLKVPLRVSISPVSVGQVLANGQTVNQPGYEATSTINLFTGSTIMNLRPFPITMQSVASLQSVPIQ